MKSVYCDVMTVQEKISPRMAGVTLFFLAIFYGAMCLYGSWMGFTGNFDTGTVELMAVNIAKGDDFPLFWYGLHYAGALEAYVAAAMIWLFGFSETALTLSPIVFSILWIIGTYLLFAEIIDRRAGLLAVVAVIFSGYFSWYYSFALSGGYSVILALGTLIMWLGIRLYRRNPSFWLLCIHVLGIGFMAALAIWVHFFIFPYLLVSAIFLLLHAIRRRFALKILCCYVAGAMLAACGFLPYFVINYGNVSGSSVSSFLFTKHHLLGSLQTLFFHDLPQYVFWKQGFDLPFNPTLLYVVYGALIIVVSAIALFFILRRRNSRAVFLLFAPLLYLVIYFSMFLPHKMSTIPSPRYLLSPWVMFVAMIWAYASAQVSSKKGRIVFTGLFVFWIGYGVFSDYFFIQLVAPEKIQRLQEAQDIVNAVQSQGIGAVTMLGNERYGYEGQKLSALSGNEIRFVFSDKERYQKNAQSAENEAAYGFMCKKEDRRQVLGALQPLAISFHEVLTGKHSIFSDFILKEQFFRRSLLSTDYSMQLVGNTRGKEGDLADRNGSTIVAWQNSENASLLVDFGSERELAGFWLFAPQKKREGELAGLPRRYRVSIASSDMQFRPVYDFHSRVVTSYIQGGHVYLSGFFGRAECRFHARHARYLKISFPGRQTVTLNEVVFFQNQACGVPGSLAKELVLILRQLKGNNSEFTLADRWLSAAVIDAMPDRNPLPALPRFNPRADNQLYSRLLIPRKGLVLAPAREVADECAMQLISLYGPEVISRRIDFAHYSLFFLDQGARRMGEKGFLYWNGHVLLRLTSFDDLAFIELSQTNFLHIDPDRKKTTGFYADSWTNGRGIIKNLHVRLPEYAREIVLLTRGDAPLAGDPEALHLQLFVDNRKLTLSRRQGNSYFFQLPPGQKTIGEIRIESLPFNPGPQDNRMLGLDVARLLVL